MSPSGRGAIHQLKDRLFIHPWQMTDMGLGIASEPYVALPLDADSASLGNAALDALNQSGRTVRHPSDWKAEAAPRLKAAVVKSEKAFQTHACYVSIELDGSQLLVEPWRNGGTTGEKKGFVRLPDPSNLTSNTNTVRLVAPWNCPALPSRS
jgi:hypothetical protein